MYEGFLLWEAELLTKEEMLEPTQNAPGVAGSVPSDLMVHISSLKMEDALNKLFDQGVRCNMRLQDCRNRLKDLQDDMRVVKRELDIEDDAKGKRLKFAADPTEGPCGDYSRDELDKKTRKLGSSCSQSFLLDHQSDLSGKVQKLTLWAASGTEEKKKEPELEKAQASKPEGLDPWATPPDAAESSYEEDNTDPDEPEVGTVSWIVFEGENEPARLDQLTAQQEMMLENGKPYRYYDIQDCYDLKKRLAETTKAQETKGMTEERD